MADDWDTTPSHTGRRRIEQIMTTSSSSSSSSSSANGNTANVQTSTKKSTSSSQATPNYKKTYTPWVIEVPTEIYVQPEQYSLARVGLEIYETDEDNYVPYVPTGTVEGVDTVEDEDAEEDDEENLAGFPLHMGEILKIHYHGDSNNVSFESNYKDMSDGGSVKVDSVDLKSAYKGVRVKLVGEWEKEGQTLVWEDLSQALLGFITEQIFSDYETEIKLSGMTKTMEMKYKFNFEQMLRSEIINQVILTAGLKPCINVDGLYDDITDFSNISDSGSSDGSGDASSTGSSSIDAAVKQAIKGKKTPLEKAKAIDKAFKNHVYYSYYWNVHHPDLEEAWRNAHLNCADGANVLCAMFNSAGLNAVIVHVPEHYVVRVTINGKQYFTDNAASDGAHTTRPFGQTWKGMTSGSVVGTKIPA